MNRFISLAFRRVWSGGAHAPEVGSVVVGRQINNAPKAGLKQEVSSIRLASNARASMSNPKVAEALKLGRLNHVAIATPDLKGATAMYR
jgi:hypothetical protein